MDEVDLTELVDEKGNSKIILSKLVSEELLKRKKATRGKNIIFATAFYDDSGKQIINFCNEEFASFETLMNEVENYRDNKVVAFYSVCL